MGISAPENHSLIWICAWFDACTLFNARSVRKTGVRLRIRSAGVLLRTSTIDIGIEFGRIGLGIVLREIRCSIDDLAYLGIDGLQLLLVHLGRQPPIADLLDRVLIVPYLIDFLAGTIFRRVRH